MLRFYVHEYRQFEKMYRTNKRGKIRVMKDSVFTPDGTLKVPSSYLSVDGGPRTSVFDFLSLVHEEKNFTLVSNKHRSIIRCYKKGSLFKVTFEVYSGSFVLCRIVKKTSDFGFFRLLYYYDSCCGNGDVSYNIFGYIKKQEMWYKKDVNYLYELARFVKSISRIMGVKESEIIERIKKIKSKELEFRKEHDLVIPRDLQNYDIFLTGNDSMFGGGNSESADNKDIIKKDSQNEEYVDEEVEEDEEGDEEDVGNEEDVEEEDEGDEEEDVGDEEDVEEEDEDEGGEDENNNEVDEGDVEGDVEVDVDDDIVDEEEIL